MKYLKKLLLFLLILLLAGCTQDKSTLSDLCPVERDSVTCIDLHGVDGYACMGTPDFLKAAWELLDSVEYDPQQLMTGEFDFNDANFYLQTIYFFVGEEPTPLYVSGDFSQLIPVWDKPIDQKSGTYEYYPIKSPEKLEAFFGKYIDMVYNRDVTAQPFAALGQPYEWAQGVTSDVLSWVRVGYSFSSNSATSVYLSRVAYEEVEQLLKTLPESAFSAPETLENAWMGDITVHLSDYPNLALTFQDKANDLGVILRYYVEADNTPHLEFFMVDSADAVSRDNSNNSHTIQKWDVDSPELLAWFRENEPLPSYVNLRSGHWMDFDEDRGYITATNGDVTIRVRSFVDWDYEVVEEAESFGIRIRHPQQTEGSICLSFWPKGYESAETNRYIQSNNHSYTSLPLTILYPNGIDSEGAIWTESVTWYETGDYVELNEGADRWFEKFADEIQVQLMYSSVEAGEQVSKAPPEMVVDLAYTQCDDPKYSFRQFDFETADRAYLSLSGRHPEIPCGWVYDDTPEGENVLLTFWPEFITEGMVCVEYHEGFFQPPEGMTVEEDILHIDSTGAHPAKRGTLPGDDRWSYLWIDRKNGSYVFRFENTEHWDIRRIEECVWALHTFQFRG